MMKVTQKEIRRLLADEDSIRFDEAYKAYAGRLDLWHEYLDRLDLLAVACSCGVYGMNGLVYWSRSEGCYCGVAQRSSVLYTLPNW